MEIVLSWSRFVSPFHLAFENIGGGSAFMTSRFVLASLAVVRTFFKMSSQASLTFALTILIALRFINHHEQWQWNARLQSGADRWKTWSICLTLSPRAHAIKGRGLGTRQVTRRRRVILLAPRALRANTFLAYRKLVLAVKFIGGITIVYATKIPARE